MTGATSGLLVACTCTHAKGEHKHGKGPCLVCSTCLAFERHRPPLADGDGQFTMFEEAAHQRARIFDALRAVHGSTRAGLTFEEVTERTALPVDSVRGRLSEMEAEGTIERAPLRRRVASGRRAALYRVKLPHAKALRRSETKLPANSEALSPKRFELREVDGRAVAVEVVS